MAHSVHESKRVLEQLARRERELRNAEEWHRSAWAEWEQTKRSRRATDNLTAATTELVAAQSEYMGNLSMALEMGFDVRFTAEGLASVDGVEISR